MVQEFLDRRLRLSHPWPLADDPCSVKVHPMLDGNLRRADRSEQLIDIPCKSRTPFALKRPGLELEESAEASDSIGHLNHLLGDLLKKDPMTRLG